MATSGSPQTAVISTGALFDEIPALANLDPADPYAAYAQLFGAPLVAAGGSVVVVTRYHECYELLRHPHVMNRRDTSPAFRGLTASFMHMMDPPEHTRIRSIVNKALTRRSVEALKPWLEREVHRLLDRPPSAVGRYDVITELAYPLPLNAICQMLDVPMADRGAITGWSRSITYGSDLLAGRRSTIDQHEFRTAIGAFRRYIQKLTEERRRAPKDDLLSRLILAEETGDRLTDREITWTAIGLLVTGHETTVSLIAHGAIALSRHPEMVDRVATDEDFADAFIEEILRYDSPVQAAVRIAAEDLRVDTVDVRADSALLLILGAANRDPDQFADPDSFDVDRRNNRTHLAFGGGPHFCPGAALSRLETRLALMALAQRFVNPRLDADGVRYRKGTMMRTPTVVDFEVDDIRPRQNVGSAGGAPR